MCIRDRIINIADNVKAKINYVNSTTNGFLNLLVEYNIGNKSELEISRINSSQGLLVETNLVFLLNHSNFNMKNLSMPIESSRLQLFSNHIGEKSSCSSKTISIPSENSNDDILVDNIFSKSNCESVSGVRALLYKDKVISFQSMIFSLESKSDIPILLVLTSNPKITFIILYYNIFSRKSKHIFFKKN